MPLLGIDDIELFWDVFKTIGVVDIVPAYLGEVLPSGDEALNRFEILIGHSVIVSPMSI